MAGPAPAREWERLPMAPPSKAPPPAPTKAPVCALLSQPTELIPIAPANTATAADFIRHFIFCSKISSVLRHTLHPNPKAYYIGPKPEANSSLLRRPRHF